MKLLCFLVGLLAMGSLVQGEEKNKMTFHNHHDKMVTLYWDTYKSDPLANGLARIADVVPGGTSSVCFSFIFIFFFLFFFFFFFFFS